MARPTIRTPEIIMKLEEAFSLGSTDSSACFYAGIGESTYYKWCEDDEELRERMKALKDKPIMIALRKVTEELSEDINTAKWYLEREAS